MSNKRLSSQVAPVVKNKAFSGIASYCPISGVLVTSTKQFGGTSISGLFMPVAHPLFALPNKEFAKLIADLLQRGASATEQYLVVLSLLHRIGAIIPDAPMTGTSEKIVAKAWNLLIDSVADGYIDYIFERLATGKKLNIPVMRVTPSSGTDGALYFHLKLVLGAVSSQQSTAEMFKISAPSEAQLEGYNKLDYDLSLEAELRRMMTEGASTKFSMRTMKRSLKQLALSELVSELDLHLVRKVLTTDIDDLLTDTIKEALKVCKHNMDLHSPATRNENLATINQIEGKLQQKLAAAEATGFILLEEELGAASDTIRYQTKTKVVEQMPDLVVAPVRNAAGIKLTLREQMALRKAMKEAGGK